LQGEEAKRMEDAGRAPASHRRHARGRHPGKRRSPEELRFEAWADALPISIWAEDFSTVHARVGELRSEGVADICAYLWANPDEVRKLAAKVKILGVNRKSVEILGADSRERLMSGMPDNFTPDALRVFTRELCALVMGSTSFDGEIPIFDFAGQPRTLWLHLAVKEGHEHDLSLVLVSFIDITERKAAEKALLEERRLFIGGPTVAFKWRAAEGWPVDYVSPNLLERFGYTPEDLTSGRVPYASIVHPDDLARVVEEVESHGASGVPCFEQEYRIARADGEWRWVHDFTVVVRDSGGCITRYDGHVADVTERKQAEDAQRRLDRELRAISECNQALLHATDEQRLLDEVCRIICDRAGYRLAWVGYAEGDPEKTVRPVAWAGADSDHVAHAKLTWSDRTELGRGPAGIVIHTGESIYTQDFATDERMGPWREAALRRGCRSGIGLPLKDHAGRTFGVLLIYASEPDAVSPEEVRLLTGLADDLAFGIVALRTRTERDRAEQELRRVNRALQTISECNQELVRIDDEPALLSAVCRILVETGGYAAASVTYGQKGAATNVPAAGALAPGPEAETDLERPLHLPLLVGGEAVGTLDVFSHGGSAFEPHELQLLRELAADLAFGIGSLRTRQAHARAEADLLLYRQLTNESNDCILVLDLETGRVLDANDTACRLLGYSREELLRLGLDSLDASLQDPARLAQALEALRGGLVSVRTTQQLRKDGSTFPVEVSMRCATQRGRQYLIAVVRDITERTRAEEQVRKLSEAVEQSPASIVITDLGGAIEYVNPSFTELTGYAMSEVRGQNPRVLQSGLTPPEVYRELWAAIAAGERWHGEFCNRKKSGELFWESASISPIRDAAGQVRHFLAVKQDITRARELDRAIRAAADEWMGTFDAMEFAVLLVGADDTVARLNHAAARLAGRGERECVGRPLPELGEGEPWQTARQAVARIRASGHVEPSQVSDEGGRVWHVDATAGLATATAEPRAVVTIRDVTAISRLQEALKRSETMVAMGALVAGVAHEVRNPLFAMSVNVDALVLELGDRPDLRELVDALRTERDRINRLMENLLHYSRPPTVVPTPQPLERVLAEAVAACASLASHREVSIEREGEASALLVSMNAERLEEVFENLLENACQHSPAGGRVRLAVQPAAEEGLRGVRVEVTDSGPGFAPEAQARAFEPFYTRRKGGIGLGLAIVQRIVEAHRGRVSAGNVPGGGAVMTVWLPLASVAP
jgi:PAS domain S-box-containing protein